MLKSKLIVKKYKINIGIISGARILDKKLLNYLSMVL